MAGKEAYSVSKVIDVLRKTKGTKGPAAATLGCTWQTVDNYAKRHPTIQKVIDEEREGMTDVAELSLYRAVQGGEAWAVCFYLKTQGKKRGYVERATVEVSGPEGGPVRHEVAITDDTIVLLNSLAEAKAGIASEPVVNGSANGSHV